MSVRNEISILLQKLHRSHELQEDRCFKSDAWFIYIYWTFIVNPDNFVSLLFSFVGFKDVYMYVLNNACS